MKKFCLIGKKLERSLSPYIYNYVFNHLKIDAEYKLVSLNSRDEIPSIFSAISRGEIGGANITNPYKIDAFNYLDSHDSVAYNIGSINCVSQYKDQAKGFNTDWRGFQRATEGITSDCISIIGYGGAAKAVEYTLLSEGVKNIRIYTREKINHPNNVVYKDIDQIFNQTKQKEGIIINATPHHFINEIDFDKILFLSSEKLIWIDLLYTKLSTDRRKYFDSNSYKNGIDMLIYQAFESLNIWFRKDVAKDVDFNSLKSYLERVNDVI